MAPTFMAIIWSRNLSPCALQSFRIWFAGDQSAPLELIGETWTGLRAFNFLPLDLNVEQDQSLVAKKAVQEILKLPVCKPFVHHRIRALRYSDSNQADTRGKYCLTLPTSITKKASIHSPLRLKCGDEEENPSDYDSLGDNDDDDDDDDDDDSLDYNPLDFGPDHGSV